MGRNHVKAEHKRLQAQAELDKLVEAEYNDYDSSYSPDLIINNTANRFSITSNQVIASLRRRAELRGEIFADPRYT